MVKIYVLKKLEQLIIWDTGNNSTQQFHLEATEWLISVDLIHHISIHIYSAQLFTHF